VLDPDSVQNIEVVVGAMAAGRYGDKSRNGVVIITTKSGVSDTTSSAKLTRARRLLTQLNARDPISASPAIIDPPRNPPPFVHVVDDLVVTPEAADEAARTQRFTRIEIIRGTEAAQLYGTRAAPGVIIITTR
jgi:outer membrane cobalamin receptor